MKFLSDILAKAGLTVDGVVTLNNTATGQTPDANDNSTKLATTAWVRTFVQPYSLPIASASVLGGIKVGSGLSINSGTGVLSVVGASAASIKSTQTFVVTEGQTVFTVTGGYTPGLIDIFLNGVYLSPNQTVATNGTTFTINDPAAAGDIVDVIVASAIFEGSASTTDQLPEGSINLYYTNTRARAAITLTTTGVSGAATYNSSTGVFNIPNYQGLVPAGGVAGDILAKVSGTNYDVTWIPNYTSTVQHTVKAAVAVTKGQAVYVSSADGTNMIVSKASNASEGTSSKTLGLVAQNLAINGQGFVVTEGLLAGLNTSTAQAGDPVWLGTDGNLIYGLANKPYAPAHLVFIGIVTRVQQNNGEIFVKVQNGFELQELHNVQITTTPSDNTVLSYETSTSLYKMKSIATLLGYTPANAARTLTINGTSYDLTADRTWNVGTVTSVAALTIGTSGTDITSTVANSTTTPVITLNVPDASAFARGVITTGIQTIAGGKYFSDNVAIGHTSPFDVSQFSLDINGGLLVKNSSKTAQFVLINSNPALGGNNAFVVHTVGGSSGTSYADIQGYYGTSIAGSTVLRLNPQGGNVLIGNLAGTGNRMVVASATGVLSTQAIQTLSDLSGVPTARTLTINGVTFDLSANRSWTINSMVYPSAGIAVSTGTAWGTSITDNSSNWNTAFSWGNHASAGYATTTYVNTQVANLVASAPATLDTLNELAAALGNDAAFSTTVTTALGNRLRIDTASQGLTSTQQGNGRTNLGLGSLAVLSSVANAQITDVAWSKVTGAPAFITGYTEVDTLASVTGRGATTSTATVFNGGLFARRAQTAGNYTTAALWTESYDNTTTGIAFHISGNQGKFLEMRTDGILYWHGSTVWHSGNLTNLNQLSNGPGYLTSVTNGISLTTQGSALNAASSPSANIGVWGGTWGFIDLATNNAAGGWIDFSKADGTDYSGRIRYQNSTDTFRIFANATEVVYISSAGIYRTNGTEYVYNTGTWGISITGNATTSTRVGAQSVDLNSGRTPGTLEYYDQPGGTGAPNGNWHSYISTRHGNSANQYGFQIANQFGSETLLFRGWDGSNPLTWRTLWHSGNLTNLNQLSNGPGYITGYTETDTLATVMARGSSTSSGITFTASGGSILLKHAVSEVDAWIFQENAANWGIYWKNAPSGHHTFGGYTTVGAETFGMSAANVSGNGVLTSNFVGATSAYAQWMLSNYTGYIWSASTIFAAGDMRAPIYYDSQDTSYYGDFNDQSRFAALKIGNQSTFNSGATYALQLSHNNRYLLALNYNNSSWYPWLVNDTWNGLEALIFHFNGIGDRFFFNRGGHMRADGNITAGGSVSAANGMGMGDVWGYGGIYRSSGDMMFGVESGGWRFHYQNSQRVYIGTDGNIWMQWAGDYISNLLGAKQNASTAINTSNIGSQSVSYANASGLVAIPDWRDTSYSPNTYAGNRVGWHFNNVSQNGGPAGDFWGAMQTVAPWSEFNTSHRQMQLWWGGSVGLSYRYAVGSGYTPTGWSGWERIMTSSNFSSWAIARGGDTVSGQFSFTKTDDHAIQVGTIRGRAVGSQGGEFIQLFERVNIGGPNGWGASNTGAPTYGLSVFGGANIGYGNSAGLTVTGTTTLNGQVYINRHIDANTSWGSCTSIFVGWGGGKVILGNSASGGHDYALNLGCNTVVSTNPFFCYQDITAYSDARVKDNVEVVDNAVKKIKGIRGVTFTRNDTDDKTKRYAGVIAQEVLAVLPEAVSEDLNGHYSVAYGNLNALLIEAIKEQQTQIESQKSEIEELKDLVKQLINR